MNRLFKTVVLGAAVAATTFAALPSASAGDRYWRHHGGNHYHGNYYRGGSYSGGDLAVAGVLGLAAGALAVGIASQPAPAYVDPYYDDYGPRPVRVYPRDGYARYAGEFQPWSPGWYDYCSARYRSFKPRTGTFTGYDGQQHFCVAN